MYKCRMRLETLEHFCLERGSPGIETSVLLSLSLMSSGWMVSLSLCIWGARLLCMASGMILALNF